MNRRTKTALCATLGIAGFAILPSGPIDRAVSWDGLCGANESEAHVCASGEPDRFGNIPNPAENPSPAPTPSPPEAVPAALVQLPPPPSATPTPGQPVRHTCRYLLHHEPRSGRRHLIDRGCIRANPPDSPPAKVGTFSCSSRWENQPKGFATFRGPDRWWHPFYAKGGAINCGHNPPVAGSINAVTFLGQAKGWALAIVRSAGDRWTSGNGSDNGQTASYTFVGRRLGLGPTEVRGVVMGCGVPATSPVMICTGHFTQGPVRGSLYYRSGTKGGFTAKATLTRLAR